MYSVYVPKDFCKTLSAMSLRIGIPVNFQHSCFSTGFAKTVLTVAEIYMISGHTVELIRLNTDSTVWWDDVKTLQSLFTCVSVNDMKEYDLLIEIGIPNLSAIKRKHSKKSVWLNCKPAILHDIEASLYPITQSLRDMTGIHEIWIYDEMCNTDDIQYLELLTKKPVRVLPYIWSPLVLEYYKKETSISEWKYIEGLPWSIHICETNTSSSSSSTIPLFVMREIKHKTDISLNKSIKIHNIDAISKTDFFNKNVLDHVFSDISGVEPVFIGRQRIVDFMYEPNSILLGHSRFIPFRPYVLDAIWLGIPVVHNSTMIREYYPDGYYTSNSIHEGRLAFEKVVTTIRQKTTDIRKKMLDVLSPMSAKQQAAWNLAATSLMSISFTPTEAVSDVAASAAEPVQDAYALKVGFCSMWSEFNANYNMFTLMLEKFGTRKVIGIDVENDDSDIDILIFGPFSERWKSISSKIPKVHYTGENTEPIMREDVKLNIGYKHIVSDSYIRIPLWMLSIDWWNADVNRIVNPKPIPLERCCTVFADELKRKKKFCAFVVTNPCQPIRNIAFKWLNTYKSVDSAGRLYNTMGESLFAGLGGGGGELRKLEFLKDYKFCLCYENYSSPGYTTEKLLHAKAAGCIPVYWGDPTVDTDFNMEGCINANSCKTKEELVELVKEVDENYEKYLYKYNIPLLNDTKKYAALNSLTECANRIWNFATNNVEEHTDPEYISLDICGKIYSCNKITTKSPNVIISACNSKFVNSAVRLIKSSKVPVYIWTFHVTTEESKKLVDAGARVIAFDTAWNPDWPDFWNPEHYAWKPLTMSIANTVFPKGTNILYLDSGIEIVSSITNVWNMINTHSMFVLEQEHKNIAWCHSDFCKALDVTHEELEDKQLDASIIGFKCGANNVTNVMTDFMKYSCNPIIIVGKKWYAYSSTCNGHRHDQSILSIVSSRNKISRGKSESYSGYISYSDTIANNQLFYTHRGSWKQGDSLVLQGITQSFVINLDHRTDRLEKFYTNNTYLQKITSRVPGVNGRTLVLTKVIHMLFKNNDFKWKKSVMGCALSHFSLWRHTASSGTSLILEDDAILVPDFIEKWNYIQRDMPLDADVVFLGGILPPNKQAFPLVVDPINSNFAKVANNSLFSSVKRRYFHFCAYSYILTKKGAEKLCNLVSEKGIFTSADHMIVNHGDDLLNIYFTTPLLGGCIQDNDPVYQKADFNNFNRVDTIDSDIWTNKDVFTQEDIDSLYTNPVLPVIYFEEDQEKQMIDSEWLSEIFNRKFKWIIASSSESPVSGPVLLYYQHTTNPAYIEQWISKNAGVTIYLLHASDESCKSDISIYKNPRIKHIFRNYWRPDALAVNVTHLPLGYLNGKGRGDSQLLVSNKRNHLWSFAGAMDRKNRRNIIENLRVKYPTQAVHLTPTWNSPTNLNASEYVNMLRDSKYVPCLNGFWNTESYRLYEAIENGAIPIICVDLNKSYQNILGCTPPFIMLEKWSDDCMHGDDTTKQREIVEWWQLYKNGLCEKISKLLL